MSQRRRQFVVVSWTAEPCWPKPSSVESGSLQPQLKGIRERSLVLSGQPQEHMAETQALREFLEAREAHAEAGRGAMTGGTKSLWMPWVAEMSNVLSDREAEQRRGRGSKGFKRLTASGLEPELLAIITSQTVLNLLMLPCFRNKDEMEEAARQNRFGDVPFTTAAVSVGEAVCKGKEGRMFFC